MVTEEITFLPLCLYSRYLNCCLCNKAQSWPKFQLSTTDMSETHTHANVCLHTLTQNKHFRDIIYNAFSWTVNPLNENNHRNPTVAPTTPLILSISLSQSPHLAYSLHTCGHLSIGHGRMKTACAGWSDWLDHVFCWQTFTAASWEGRLSQSVHTKLKRLFPHDLLADSLNPLAEWTITCRKPYRPGVSSSGKQAHGAVS